MGIWPWSAADTNGNGTGKDTGQQPLECSFNPSGLELGCCWHSRSSQGAANRVSEEHLPQPRAESPARMVDPWALWPWQCGQ